MLSLSDKDHESVQETPGTREPTVESQPGLIFCWPQRLICAVELAPMADLSWGLTKTRCRPSISLRTVNSADKLVQTVQSSLDPCLQGSIINWYALGLNQASVLCQVLISGIYSGQFRPVGITPQHAFYLRVYLSLPLECKGH